MWYKNDFWSSHDPLCRKLGIMAFLFFKIKTKHLKLTLITLVSHMIFRRQNGLQPL
jgi:hypothetical protein